MWTYDTALELFTTSFTLDPYLTNPRMGNALAKLADKATIERVSEYFAQRFFGGERIWLSSDLHFFHANVMQYCNRFDPTVEQMNARIATALNKVPEGEPLLLLGDVAMAGKTRTAQALAQLKISLYLVAGNHDLDRNSLKLLFPVQGGPFEAVVPFLYWTSPEGALVMLTHYPIRLPENFEGKVINYHGHLHDKWMPTQSNIRYVNVGWDTAYGLYCI